MNLKNLGNEDHQIYQGSCYEVMQELIDKNIKVDAIICDMPFGVTTNNWDKKLDLDKNIKIKDFNKEENLMEKTNDGNREWVLEHYGYDLRDIIEDNEIWKDNVKYLAYEVYPNAYNETLERFQKYGTTNENENILSQLKAAYNE
ncbi:hypothetical protein [Williamsoniiplasma lucivorax]|uniref:Uncharacterized protein n=1 Tax=Williamsoniiplasma lucivorax TaxID=209274 RepID=A0A2S5RDM7_9MOLU|nr:hypothetical protein [Williamsoniiplasma lucivorax]PPE05423.1 hypothetical protein ELUCI_v1c05150 [Williamsoniiplasma lucivorax]